MTDRCFVNPSQPGNKLALFFVDDEQIAAWVSIGWEEVF